MATTEPMPMHSNSSPSVPSSTARRCLAKGTSGAQQAMPKPATRKERRVASRVAGRSDETMGGVPIRVRNAGTRMRGSGGGFARHDVDAEPSDRLELGMGGSIMFDHQAVDM